jgi:hypothetical protein
VTTRRRFRIIIVLAETRRGVLSYIVSSLLLSLREGLRAFPGNSWCPPVSIGLLGVRFVVGSVLLRVSYLIVSSCIRTLRSILVLFYPIGSR